MINAPSNFVTLTDTFKEYIRYGSFAGCLNCYGDVKMTIDTGRYALDLTFFMMVFIVLNIIKGITIDTFLEMREVRLEREEDTEKRCFICGIDELDFSRAIDRDAFKRHIKSDQNLWSYIYFIIHLWEQDKDDDDGLEWSIRRMVDEGDLSWFPLNKAVALIGRETDGKDEDKHFHKDLDHMQKNIAHKMHVFKEALQRSAYRLENALAYVPELEPKSTRRTRNSHSGVLGDGSLASASVSLMFDADNRHEEGADAFKTSSVQIVVDRFCSIPLNPQDTSNVVCEVLSEAGTYSLRPTVVEQEKAGQTQTAGSDLLDPSMQFYTVWFDAATLATARKEAAAAEAAAGAAVRARGKDEAEHGAEDMATSLTVHVGPLPSNSSLVVRVRLVVRVAEDSLGEDSVVVCAIDIPIPSLVQAWEAGSSIETTFPFGHPASSLTITTTASAHYLFTPGLGASSARADDSQGRRVSFLEDGSSVGSLRTSVDEDD